MKNQIRRPLLPWEARRLGISWPYSIGRKANKSAGREIILKNTMSGTVIFNEVKISRRYNLGNHIRQVSNAIRFAELNDIPSVRLPPGSFFSSGGVGDVELTVSDAPLAMSRPAYLSGDFFYFEKLGIPLERLERGRVIRALRPRVPLLLNTTSVAKLGIHLRSGDTFTPNPHPLYMPPPLRFFLDAIERSQSSHAGGVHLICQDLAHPYVGPIAEYCSQQNIDCEVTSSSLDEDFRSLARFEELCISQGTLALAAAWLSSHCKTIFGFERDLGELRTTAELGIRLEHATSRTDLGLWKGTDGQMSLLSDPNAASLSWQSRVGLEDESSARISTHKDCS